MKDSSNVSGFQILLKITGTIAAFLLIMVGLVLFGYGGYEGVMSVKTILFDIRSEEKIISSVLKKVDIIFLGLVIQILGIGIYELFVAPLENLPKWLIFKDFDQLKLLLIKASITVVGISFTGRAVTWTGGESIAYYGLGIAAIIAALTYFIQVKSESKKA
ncbi:MAG: YqhA family protein [Bacteroidota bacterium]